MKSAIAFIAAFAALGSAAYAKPNVQLKLDGELAHRDAKGVVTFVPVAGLALKPGDTVRYDIVATNQGTDPAKTLMPMGKVPSGTAYEAGTASATGALRVEFSLDGGKTWAVTPTVRVQTPAGVVEQKADPARYTMVRWIGGKPLEPHTAATYSYEVRVK